MFKITWVRDKKIKPENCEICGKPEFYDRGRLELSNKTGKLIRDINNFNMFIEVVMENMIKIIM